MGGKEIIGKDFGGDGAHVALGVEEDKMYLKVTLPLSKVVEPCSMVIDQLIDKLEKIIPGDQLAMAAQAKADAKAQLVKLLSAELSG